MNNIRKALRYIYIYILTLWTAGWAYDRQSREVWTGERVHDHGPELYGVKESDSDNGKSGRVHFVFHRPSSPRAKNHSVWTVQRDRPARIYVWWVECRQLVCNNKICYACARRDYFLTSKEVAA